MDYIFKKILDVAIEMDGNVASVNYNASDYCSIQIDVGGTIYDFTVIKKEGAKDND